MKTILVFGDSNMWGEVPDKPRLTYERRFAGLLGNMLGNGCRVVEDALPGRMARMEDPLSPNHCGFRHLETALEAHSPVDLLIMQLGTNEARDMFSMNAQTIACSVERLITLAKNHPAGHNARHILLIAPHPLHPRVGEMRYGFLFGRAAYETSLGFGAAYGELAKRTGVDFLDCAPLEFALNETDGVHYAHRDHEKLARAAFTAVLRILDI